MLPLLEFYWRYSGLYELTEHAWLDFIDSNEKERE